MIIIIKKKFIKLMHQKSVIVDIIHWCWKVFFHREDFNNIIVVSLHNRMTKKEDGKTLVCDKRDRPMTYAFCGDLHLSQCFLVFYKKTPFKGGWSLPEMFFKQNYCHTCHTRFAVFFPLPSCRISSLLPECGCVSTTIIPLCTLPVEPFFRLLDFAALTKDSIIYLFS